MYLHLGQDCVVQNKDIIGIFDLDTSTVSKHTRNFLKNAEKSNQVINITYELPKSFLVTAQKDKTTVYISQIAPSTLKKRSNLK